MVLTASYFDKRLEELLQTLATKEDICSLRNIIEKQKEVINQLESKVSTLEAKVDELTQKSEESEQYSRRQCLRIGGIPLPASNKPETDNEVRNAVIKLLNDSGIKTTENVIDRAHRIGRLRLVAGKKTAAGHNKVFNLLPQNAAIQGQKEPSRLPYSSGSY